MSYITETTHTPEPPKVPLPAEPSLPPSPKAVAKNEEQLEGLPSTKGSYPAPLESPHGTTSEGVFENVATTAVATAGAVATSVGNVMGKTIGDIQNAIESYTKPESDDERELGINQDTRARLAEQSKIANAQRENRASGAVAGLVYSDESDDEDEEHRKSLSSDIKGLNLGSNGDGVHHPPVFISAAPAQIINPSPSAKGTALEPLQLSDKAVTSGALQPSLPLPSTPPIGHSENLMSPTGPPISWTVTEVVQWAKSKGFDESITDKFIGKLEN